MSAPPGDVIDRLARLAAHAPDAPGDPDDLWSRGRRRQRRTWAVVAASAMALAGVGALLVPPALRLADPPVARSPDSSRLLLPDRVREPGAWEPEFPRAPGPLVAVGVGSRSEWFSDGTAWWGVSGTTGESRFLDLPGASLETGAEPALSADGTQLAYWITGETPETLPDPDDLRPDDARPIAGVAVLDLASGDVRRWATESPRGKAAVGLAWAGDVLWWSSGDLDEGSTVGSGSYQVVNRTWDLATGERSEAAPGTIEAKMSIAPAGPSPDGFLSTARYGVRAVTRRGVGPTIRLDRRLSYQDSSMSAISPDGARIAGIEQPDPTVVDSAAHALLVGDLAPARTGDRVALEAVGAIEAHAVLGWRSADEVVVLIYDAEAGTRDVEAIDVRTGERRPLLELTGNVPDFAHEAWAGELVEAPDAPFAPDPRQVALLAAVMLVMGASVWRIIRGRRGHP